ncbi:MAG: branched-chain amino acid transport system permease protein [Actinomycetota bacterium]|nr:branched-chain amino acid transport system permease protein [Actinomycetota bacterium]MEA2566443.1 branched-chain amino acid transport system permease protein [Actinomycetota bacterium]
MQFFIQLFSDPLGFYRAHQLLLAQLGINALLTLSMYITLRAGMLTLANVGFMAVGAYVSVLLHVNGHLPLPVAVLAGALAAGLLAIPIGIPVLRLSGIFLAIATIGFGQVVVGAILNIPITGEGRGLTVPDASSSLLPAYLSLVVIAYVLWRLARTRLGMAWDAVREDALAAEAQGIDVARYRMLAFVLGAVLAGYAGALEAHINFFIDTSLYSFQRVVGVLVFATLGGIGRVAGPVVGSTVLTALPEVIRFAQSYRDALYGVILIALVIFRPQGLLGGRVGIRRVGRRVKL